MPSHGFIEVRYEELVSKQETTTRNMLAFLDLPWDPACLNFHQTRRTVITQSKWQVRQRLSPASIERWRNYEPYIGPLQTLMAIVPER